MSECMTILRDYKYEDYPTENYIIGGIMSQYESGSILNKN